MSSANRRCCSSSNATTRRRLSAKAQTLVDHPTTQNKTYLAFGEDEGAGAHCHAGALFHANARIYDWLDEVLDHRP